MLDTSNIIVDTSEAAEDYVPINFLVEHPVLLEENFNSSIPTTIKLIDSPEMFCEVIGSIDKPPMAVPQPVM